MYIPRYSLRRLLSHPYDGMDGSSARIRAAHKSAYQAYMQYRKLADRREAAGITSKAPHVVQS